MRLGAHDLVPVSRVPPHGDPTEVTEWRCLDCEWFGTDPLDFDELPCPPD